MASSVANDDGWMIPAGSCRESSRFMEVILESYGIKLMVLKKCF